jgi:hypothetical protein
MGQIKKLGIIICDRYRRCAGGKCLRAMRSREGAFGEQLISEFIEHLRKVGVQKINTLVNWNDSRLIQFFSANQFSPSKTINLERWI